MLQSVSYCQYSEDEIINVYIEQENAEVRKTKCLHNAPQNFAMHKSGQRRTMGTNLEVMVMFMFVELKRGSDHFKWMDKVVNQMLRVNIHGFVYTLKRSTVFDACLVVK